MSVEAQETVVPRATWASDGSLEVLLGKSRSSVTVKAGYTGKSGMHVVLRVGLAAQEEVLRIARSREALAAWAVVGVAGAEECDLGRLPVRSNGSPRVPKPGRCSHEAQSEAPEGAPGIDLEEALGLDAASCHAEFRCRLSLRVSATCVVQASGKATLRVEVEGELALLPRFSLAGRTAVQTLYREARGCYCSGEEVRAITSCERALAVANTLMPRPQETGDVLNLLGALHLRRKSPALAVKCLERALAFRAKAAEQSGELSALPSARSAVTVAGYVSSLPRADAALAGTLCTLGSAHQAMGAHAEAYHCQQRAAAILEHGEETEGPALAACLHGLGSSSRILGRLEEARRCYQRALELRERCLGAGHVLTAVTLNNLGAVLQKEMRYRDAVSCYTRALAIQHKTFGREHPAAAATLCNLGAAHSQLKEHRLAIDCHSRAFAIQEALGPESPDMATTMHNLGNALAAAGRGHDAARCHWRALGIWAKTVGPAHPDVAATLHSLGNVYRGLREPEAAAQCFSGALRIREATLGPTHAETARTRHCAALVGCSLGQRPAAAQELQAAVDSLINSLGSRHPWSLQARADLESLRQVMVR